MPTYDYVCRECAHQWELFQPMKARPIRKCPECGRLTAKRLIGTGAGIIFRGSGFYQTDYRSKSYKEGERAEKKTLDRSSSDGKSDSKAKSKSSNSSKS